MELTFSRHFGTILKFNKKMCRNFPYFFIIGVQRSGTTLLRLILNNHPLIAIPEESSFLMPYLKRRRLFSRKKIDAREKEKFLRFLCRDHQFKKWRLEIEALDCIHYKELTLKGAISYLYEAYAKKHGKIICGDKNPKFIRKINILADSFPQAKFIHIVRDGQDVYLSMKKREHSSVSVKALEYFCNFRTHDIIHEERYL